MKRRNATLRLKNNNYGMKIEINKLNPHPLNSRIYGYTDCTDLIESIQKTGWIKPILITRNNTIISGHRRVEACKSLEIQEVDFEYAPDDYIKQLELLISLIFLLYFKNRTHLILS